jgi:hypothetical protein
VYVYAHEAAHFDARGGRGDDRGRGENGQKGGCGKNGADASQCYAAEVSRPPSQKRGELNAFRMAVREGMAASKRRDFVPVL